MRTIRFKQWGLAAAVLVLCGCAEKLTYQRFETIHEGASRAAVEATLGEPWQTTGQEWIYYDADRGITAHVYFDDEDVIGKTWADPERGMVGKTPHVSQPGEAEQIRVRKIE